MHKALLFAVATLAAIVTSSRSHACVDTALVLAVDGSGSISDEEYEFQKSAIVAAFRDRQVLSAIRASGTVAVAAVFWGDGEFPAQIIDWTVMDGIEPSQKFADEIEKSERVVFGNTDIGDGLWVALELLSGSHACARRRIVDISGDGMETTRPRRRRSVSLLQARQRAQEMGVTINALAISDEETDLADYYNDRVILGSERFVMNIRKFEDFALAIRLKLIRELS
ncbi:DUF1194 domain-containing protein [Phyllobacterium sp. SYP-B3895]|uniref:DUF1194 domain-containing protein n=1 Tax=Phyllobacterium sp. SYP-B3895 TaxID=2663240 RepID=UPI001299562D|nr:DUF1194 domain-containing protein [Phyllobacterium sp. SYP-B3895]MRG55693.1 DUF1194 domain-containing protein [Phyllobacterium sp. SYP-B3895]